MNSTALIAQYHTLHFYTRRSCAGMWTKSISSFFCSSQRGKMAVVPTCLLNVLIHCKEPDGHRFAACKSKDGANASLMQIVWDHFASHCGGTSNNLWFAHRGALKACLRHVLVSKLTQVFVWVRTACDISVCIFRVWTHLKFSSNVWANFGDDVN